MDFWKDEFYYCQRYFQGARYKASLTVGAAHMFQLTQETQADGLETVVESQCPGQFSAVFLKCIFFRMSNSHKSDLASLPAS